MDARFLGKGFTNQLSHLIEECGEVLAAAGKTQRWGPESFNPLLPVEQRETNAQWLARELADLHGAILRLSATMEKDLNVSVNLELVQTDVQNTN